MIDIHTHILSHMDDGASSMQISVQMCAHAEKAGTRAMLATPHFIEGTYEQVNRQTINGKVNELNKTLVENGINLKVYPGCEAHLSLELPELVEKGVCMTLNGSQYLLVELPSSSIPLYTDEILYELEIQGLTPILAHPERNSAIIRDSDIIDPLKERGILFQITAGSLTGHAGKRVQQTAWELVKKGAVHFVASDAHNLSSRKPDLYDAYKMVSERIGENNAELLFKINPERILKNDIIQEITKFDKKLFKSFIFTLREIFSKKN